MEKNKKIRLFLLIGLIFVLITTSFLYVFLIVKENRNVSEMTTTQEETIAIQQRLKDLGYFNAEVTGYYGSITREAVRKFQADYGLAQTGEVDSTTADYLGINLGSQSSNDLYLIAKCIYAEARGEPYVGKVAVGAVILNRVEDPNFPNTIY
ncbi:MAG: peptidoglycan-binding protein, partial [Firmicutes bacterium]|nr:peptidoglycan-binding protein [Bacillota bacterium]